VLKKNARQYDEKMKKETCPDQLQYWVSI